MDDLAATKAALVQPRPALIARAERGDEVLL